MVGKVSYRSDLDGTVVCGWRSVCLEPFEEPQQLPENSKIT
ncbi:MAG: hypothetical protein ACR2M5_12035 [Nakamurella sp.]